MAHQVTAGLFVGRTQELARPVCRRSLRPPWQCPRCFGNCGRLATVSGRLVSSADTAACGCPAALQEAAAGHLAAGQALPPPIGPGELALQPVAELGAPVGYGRPL